MITFTVTGQALKLSAPVVAADTLNYLTARFVFQTADWDGTVKIAHFSNGTESAEVELTDDEIRAEDGLNLTEGYWQVSLTGHDTDGGEMTRRITTNIVTLPVVPSGVEDGEPLPSLPSVGEQILAQMTELRDEAELNAESAAVDAAAARYSAQSIMFPVFSVDENGHVIIKFAERLGSTTFRLNSAGHLEVRV